MKISQQAVRPELWLAIFQATLNKEKLSGIMELFMIFIGRALEQRRKNELTSLKNRSILKLPRFSPYLHGKGKSAAVLKLACFH